ncbi:hypothetical protein C1Y63_09710 [Corynebacterium sp. 13CS0277]|uniref:hypothetical protein n=1 Tax=Corynebacterium sp. 13CS0277 TaxID=2071994 RepID=UPI000D02C2BB|nr:hypothetical protein [Corynebacterium sp. 13CS0277]PRQ10727.1 hypothetical protein C1Y63_09710 [Corynebacterium sp. 13CS0277]
MRRALHPATALLVGSALWLTASGPATAQDATPQDATAPAPVVRAAVTDRQLSDILLATSAASCGDLARDYPDTPRNLTAFRTHMHTTGFPARGFNLTANQERRLMNTLEQRLMDCRALDDDRSWPARVTSFLSQVFGPLAYAVKEFGGGDFGVTRFD